jgi:beta-1,4-mannosyl-glycoprotein beta-1,4-N-acetylglucosaminyltransferase
MDCPGGMGDPWLNENHQRNAIAKALLDANPKDIIIISDLDEIPRPESIQHYDPRYLRGDFEQQYYSYYFNNLLVEPSRDVVWMGSKITLKKHFDTFFNGKANAVRSYKSNGLLRSLKRSWFKSIHTHKIPDGGWHFTWVLSYSDILKKMDAMAHRENDRQEWRTPAHILGAIHEGRDIVRADRRYKLVDIDDSFPLPLRAITNDYQDYLRLPTPGAA